MRPLCAFIASLLCVSLAHAGGIQRKHKPWLAAPKQPSPAAVALAAPPIRRGGKGEEIVKQAASYRGTRYRFGGSSAGGMDCSGLVARVWQDLQMNKLPRASASLYQKGTPVKLSQLQPGDLVFFKNTYKRGISHVGVYAGRNKFIHASARRGVSVAKLSEPYYQLRYAGARRLF